MLTLIGKTVGMPLLGKYSPEIQDSLTMGLRHVARERVLRDAAEFIHHRDPTFAEDESGTVYGELVVMDLPSATALQNLLGAADDLLSIASERRASNAQQFIGSDLERAEPILRALLTAVRGDVFVSSIPGAWDGTGERPVTMRGKTVVITLAAHEVVIEGTQWRTVGAIRVSLPEEAEGERTQLVIRLPDGIERTPEKLSPKLVQPHTIRLTASGTL